MVINAVSQALRGHASSADALGHDKTTVWHGSNITCDNPDMWQTYTHCLPKLIQQITSSFGEVSRRAKSVPEMGMRIHMPAMQ